MSKGKEIFNKFSKKTRQIAAVKCDADITVAHANRDAGIQEAECQKVRKFEPILSEGGLTS